jgi:FlaA1/EpsC-like NDP-sugar epimerase
MIRLSGKQPGVDIEIVYTGLRPGEKLYEELLSNKENTLPTYHDKIMIAKVREYDFQMITDKIDRLLNSARMHYTYETVSLMKDLVPEFISNNSAFESLDVKL